MNFLLIVLGMLMMIFTALGGDMHFAAVFSLITLGAIGIEMMIGSH